MALSFLSSLPFYIERPNMIYLLIPLIVVLFILIMKSFVKFDSLKIKKIRRNRFWLLFSRTIILTLLVFALMNPYINKKEINEGQPTVTILYDNSTSMELFDFDIQKFKDDIEKQVATSIIQIASGDQSNLGDEVFRNLDQQNILLVTDGNNNGEISFSDIVAFANNKNISINVLNLIENRKDTSISIKGAQTAIVDTDYSITIELENNDGAIPVTVTVDGSPVFEGTISDSSKVINYRMKNIGYHKIKATINDKDHFSENNNYYKVVEVVEKPKVYYMSSRNSAIDKILGAKYELYTGDTFPSNIDPFHSIIINDKMMSIGSDQSNMLERFVDDGNGLVVIGGENSFIGPSNIDLLLPVKSGQTEEKGTSFNYLFLFDMSGFINSPIMPTEQAALSMMSQLTLRAEKIQIAAGEFAHKFEMYKGFDSPSNYEEFASAIKDHGDQTAIYGAAWLRPSNLAAGLRGALDTFEGVKGNNNIVVITDGNIRDNILEKSVEVIKQLRDMGIRVHVYHIDNPDLDATILKRVNQELSSAGRGLFMTKERDINSLFEKGLIIANKNHWVTEGLNLAAFVTEHNDVIANPSADVLVSTGTGVPIITTSGFDRVAVISTDDGNFWSSTMYEPQNIAIVSRLMDWSIGDPNRKKSEYIRITPSEVDDQVIVEYKGNNPPGGCEFYKIGDTYECKFVNSNAGFHTFANVPYAVNYDEEYKQIGLNSNQLEMITRETGGIQNSPNSIEFIVNNAEQKSRFEVITKYYLDWIFVIGALVMFLLELIVRRLTERFNNDDY